MLDLNNKSLLITGGTGSLGKELSKTILEKWPNVKRLAIFSRNEQKQFQMDQEFLVSKYKAIGPNCEHEINGVHPSKKILEKMITSSDSFTTYDLGKLDDYISHFNAKKVAIGFSYNSENNI